MKTPLVFLFALCFSLTYGNVRYEQKPVDTKTTRGSSEFQQVTKTSTVKTPSGRAIQEDLQSGQQNFGSSAIHRDLIRDDSQQPSQHTRRQPTSIQNQDQIPVGSAAQRNNQQQSLPQYPQRGTLSNGQASVQPQVSEHIQDFSPSQQQQGFVEGYQQPANQERYFKDRNEAENQRIARPFLDSASEQMKIEEDSRIAKAPIQEYRQGPLYISAVDTRANPMNTLPRLAQGQSPPMIVSGVKNMPLFPAVVYNVKTAPSPQAIVYGRDTWYKGGASVRHHYESPSSQFDYNHPLQ